MLKLPAWLKSLFPDRRPVGKTDSLMMVRERAVKATIRANKILAKANKGERPKRFFPDDKV
jgi:hypothetical protein